MFKRLNLPLIISVVLILVAGVGYYKAFTGAQDLVDVVVAGTDLPPFIAVQEAQLSHVNLSSSSVRPGDMTWQYYKEHYGSAADASQIIPVYTVVAGQVLDINVLAKSPQESFSIVLPDERVVAVTSSIAGAALGTIQPGDVVDAQTSGSGGASIVAAFAKVLCIATSSSGCRGVLPAGQDVIAGVKDTSYASNGGPIKLLLVVAATDANELAGKDVALSLNTQCGIDQYGYFTQARASYPCAAPSDRDASQGAKKSPAQTKSKTTTTGTSTTTTPTTTTGTSTTPTFTTTTGTSTISTSTSQNTTTSGP